ncbi:DUF6046 domain-containing protein [Aurantibacillus circumpalustris]|uniref:DUF6046 domain-containing protein n=1 Tax=Aurantibacillus circumpalustris TaxID=3036359 RepID=UPI00295BFE47|nr:DUF6046 domain-containing protein [Aurantibacillus circumpalustris]
MAGDLNIRTSEFTQVVTNKTALVKKSKYDLRILDMLRFSFGYRRIYFPTVGKTKKGLVNEYDDLKAVEFDVNNRSAYLNTPILMPLKIQISAKGEELEYFTLPNEPIIEIRGSKKRVDTDIDGQDGTFKELYSLGDYKITIRGIAVDEDYDREEYPEDIVRKLRTIYELKHHLEVECPLFTIFNIKYISFDDFSLIPQPGEQSMAPYEFVASSDKEYKLELKRKSAS